MRLLTILLILSIPPTAFADQFDRFMAFHCNRQEFRLEFIGTYAPKKPISIGNGKTQPLSDLKIEKQKTGKIINPKSPIFLTLDPIKPDDMQDLALECEVTKAKFQIKVQTFSAGNGIGGGARGANVELYKNGKRLSLPTTWFGGLDGGDGEPLQSIRYKPNGKIEACRGPNLEQDEQDYLKSLKCAISR